MLRLADAASSSGTPAGCAAFTSTIGHPSSGTDRYKVSPPHFGHDSTSDPRTAASRWLRWAPSATSRHRTVKSKLADANASISRRQGACVVGMGRYTDTVGKIASGSTFYPPPPPPRWPRRRVPRGGFAQSHGIEPGRGHVEIGCPRPLWPSRGHVARQVHQRTYTRAATYMAVTASDRCLRSASEGPFGRRMSMGCSC